MRPPRLPPVLLVLGSSFVGCGADPGALAGREGENTESLTVCASGSVVSGIDVSYYEDVVDWPAVKAAGKDFAFIRVSDGTGTIDTQFANNWPGARAAGVIRGPYQFFRAGESASAQANLFLTQVDAAGGFQPGDLPPVVDIEVSDGQPVSVITQKLQQWLALVAQATGRTPLLYTSPGVWATIGSPSGFGSYPLWVAHYGVSCPRMPTSFTTWKFWQFTDSGTVSGISSSAVDLDQFNGTLADLRAFANSMTPSADAGMNPPDASPSDASLPGADAAGPRPDAGGAGRGDAAPDGRSGSPADSALGRGCTAAPAGRTDSRVTVLALLLALSAWRRRGYWLPIQASQTASKPTR